MRPSLPNHIKMTQTDPTINTLILPIKPDWWVDVPPPDSTMSCAVLNANKTQLQQEIDQARPTATGNVLLTDFLDKQQNVVSQYLAQIATQCNTPATGGGISKTALLVGAAVIALFLFRKQIFNA